MLGMIKDLSETYKIGSLIDCDSNEEFLVTKKKIVNKIQTKATDILDITRKAIKNHEKGVKTFSSRATCPGDVNMLFVIGDPSG